MAALGSNGGGLRVLAPGLTNADAIAHAIVGAARAYGDDPVQAVLAPVRAGSGGRAGRSVIAAISALAVGTGDSPRLARLFGRSPSSIRSAQASGRRGFDVAEIAARASVQTAQAKARNERSSDMPAPDVDEVGPELVLAVSAPEPPPLPSSEPEPSPPAPAPAPFQRDADNVTAHVRPPPIAPRVVMPMASLSDRILTTLERGPRNTSSLAVELEVKELLVGQCLSALRHEKRVRSDASFGLGRALLWVLAESAAA